MIFGYVINPTAGGSVGLGEFNWSVIQENEIHSSIFGIDFEIIAGGLSQSHLNIVNNDIIRDLGLGAGIRLMGVDEPLQDIHIRDDNFIDMNLGLFGIIIINLGGANVRDNIIDMGANSHGGIPSGIFLVNAENTFLQCNQVLVDENNTNHIRGIRVVGASPGTILNSNRTVNTTEGLYFADIAMVSQVRCNTMENCNTGLRIEFNAQTGDQREHRNRWIGNFGIGTVNANPQFLLSLFTRTNTANQSPPNWFPDEWFIFSEDAINCPGCGNGGGSGGGIELPKLDKLDSLIASTGVDIGIYTPGYNWILKYQLYLKLLKYPHLLQNNLLMSLFKNSYEQGTGGQFFDLRHQVNQLYEIAPGDQIILDNNAIAIQSILEDLQALDSLLAENYNLGGDPTNLLIDRAIKYNQVQSLQEQSKSIFDSYTTNRLNMAPSILADVKSISTNEKFEINEQNLQDILLNTEVINQPPTLAQKSVIKSIAEECFYEGGMAVYKARALYEIWTGEAIEGDTCEYNSANENYETPVSIPKVNTTFKIAPNPADGTILLSYTVPENTLSARLDIISYTGQIIATYFLPTKRERYILPTETIANGFYFVRLTTDQGFHKSTKVIIQH